MKENVGTQKLKKSEHLLLSALTLSPKKKMSSIGLKF